MAKIYKDFEGNLMSFAKSFARLNGQPLDKSEIWYNLADAQRYAATDESYVGLILAVIDSENNNVIFYGILDTVGNLKEIGSNPIGDELSVEIINGTIQLKNFGKKYYAYIPAIIDDETGEVIETSKYVLTEGFKTNLEPRVIADGENFTIAWYERNNEDIEIITNAVNELKKLIGTPADEDGNLATGLHKDLEDVVSSINKKANIADVYTKLETNVAIATALTNIDHLKRIIVNSIEDIHIQAEDALNYIYMISAGTQLNNDKYDEYIVIELVNIDNETNEEIIVRQIEKIGSWETDLSQYVKTSEFEALEKVVDDNKKATELSIALKANLSTTLSGYGINDAYTKEEVNTKIEDALKNLNNGEKNFISSVSDDFTVTTGKLELNNIEIAKVNGLETALNNKVEVVQGSRLINADEIQLLENLAKGQFNNNFITSVDTNVFSVNEGSLYLEQVPVASLNALGDFSTLPHANEEDYTLVKEINNLYSMLTWNDMS